MSKALREASHNRVNSNECIQTIVAKSDDVVYSIRCRHKSTIQYNLIIFIKKLNIFDSLRLEFYAIFSNFLKKMFKNCFNRAL